MILSIYDIPETGLDYNLSPQTEWAVTSLKQHLTQLDSSSLTGALHVTCVEAIIHVSGTFSLLLKSLCDRCTEAFDFTLSVSIDLDFLPAHADSEPLKNKRFSEEEVELTVDDVSYGFYHGEEINLASLVSEQALLVLPQQFLCTPDCKGLCPQCGINKNQQSCSCEIEKTIDPRWEALRKLKK